MCKHINTMCRQTQFLNRSNPNSIEWIDQSERKKRKRVNAKFPIEKESGNVKTFAG